MTTIFRAWSTAASGVRTGPRGRGREEAPPKAASWGADREHQPRKVALASRTRGGGSLELRWAAPSRPSELGSQLTCPLGLPPQVSASC